MSLKSRRTAQAQSSYPEIIQFLRQSDYRFVEELGRGACGVTIKLFDEEIGEYFACKKFNPLDGLDESDLFIKFLEEIKLLFNIGHNNIVRVFNYHVFKKQSTAYILMEYVDGYDVNSYLKLEPGKANEIFLQTINGFSHLESKGILHRDVRPQNIVVSKRGVPKIIDFGFGKRVSSSSDFDKSITLNWPVKIPKEFKDGEYNFSTEVYFVGKLFESAIQDKNSFKYAPILERMCEWDPKNRSGSFLEVNGEIAGENIQVQFMRNEREIYQNFSGHVYSLVRKVDTGVKLSSDADKLSARLSDVYTKVMLEESVPDPTVISSELLLGSYTYSKNYNFPTEVLGDFADLLRRAPTAKRSIILANLNSKLATIERKPRAPAFDSEDDDIPF